jgi:hypothetical protein
LLAGLGDLELSVDPLALLVLVNQPIGRGETGRSGIQNAAGWRKACCRIAD